MAFVGKQRAFLAFVTVSVGACCASAAVQTPTYESGDPIEFPGAPAGFDNDFSSGASGVKVCQDATSNPGTPDSVLSVALTTDSTNRLVGISFTCSEGSKGSAYTGGRSGPLSTDKTTSGTFNGDDGPDAAVILSGAVGEATEDGGDIISGLTISESYCMGGADLASVTGGSGKLYYNPNSPAASYPYCSTGDRLIGFQYSAGDYFNGLQLLFFSY